MNSICKEASIETEIDMYSFNNNYFKVFIEGYSNPTNTGMGTLDSQHYIHNLGLLLEKSNSNVLNKIRDFVINNKNDNITSLVKNFNIENAILCDQSHDFHGGRCIPNLNVCHKQYSNFISDQNDYVKNLKIEPTDINNLSNENFEYIIVDTNPQGISYTLINTKRHFNMVSNVIDSAGCSFSTDKLHYKLIPVDLELFIINLAFGFYQSFFTYLQVPDLDQGPKLIFLTISLPTNDKKSFMQNKKYNINLYIKYKGNFINCGFYQVNGGGGSNGDFSVGKICKMLNLINNGFTKFLYNNLLPHISNSSTLAKTIVSICLLMKGFGDFGQMFSVCFMYNMFTYNQQNNKEKKINPLYNNCIFTTVDTFLFRIAHIFECPVVIGTQNIQYYSIDTSLKYSGFQFIVANNANNKLQIYHPSMTIPTSTQKNTFLNEFKNKLISILNLKLQHEFDNINIIGLSIVIKNMLPEKLFLKKNKCAPSLFLKLQKILENTKLYINQYIYEHYFIRFNINDSEYYLSNINDKDVKDVLLYPNYFGFITDPYKKYPNKNDTELKTPNDFNSMRTEATKNNHYTIYLNALSEYIYINDNFNYTTTNQTFPTLFELIEKEIFTHNISNSNIKESNFYLNFNKTIGTIYTLLNEIKEKTDKVKPKEQENCIKLLNELLPRTSERRSDTIKIAKHYIDNLSNELKIIDDIYKLVKMHINNINSIKFHIKQLNNIRNEITKKGSDHIHFINTLITDFTGLSNHFLEIIFPVLNEKIIELHNILFTVLNLNNYNINDYKSLVDKLDTQFNIFFNVCDPPRQNPGCENSVKIYVTSIIKNVNEMLKLYNNISEVKESFKNIENIMTRAKQTWGTIKALVKVNSVLKNIQNKNKQSKVDIEKAESEIKRLDSIESNINSIIYSQEYDDENDFCEDNCSEICNIERKSDRDKDKQTDTDRGREREGDIRWGSINERGQKRKRDIDTEREIIPPQDTEREIIPPQNTERDKDREREIERDREREKKREREREKDRQTDTDRGRERERDIYWGRNIERSRSINKRGRERNIEDIEYNGLGGIKNKSYINITKKIVNYQTKIEKIKVKIEILKKNKKKNMDKIIKQNNEISELKLKIKKEKLKIKERKQREKEKLKIKERRQREKEKEKERKLKEKKKEKKLKVSEKKVKEKEKKLKKEKKTKKKI